jgi:hypothetical protein
VPFLQGVKDTVVRDKVRIRLCKKLEKMEVREETSAETGMQHWNKGQRLKEAAMFEKRQDIQQDLQVDPRARDRKENSRIFRQDSKNECQGSVEGLAPPKQKNKPHGVRAMDGEALTTIGTFAHMNRRTMMVINLDRLATYEGTAWDGRE